MDGHRIAVSPIKVYRPWWRDPVAIGIGFLVVLASLAVVFENRIVPPKPVDPTAKIVMPGGGSFCDPVPLPPGSSSQHP